MPELKTSQTAMDNSRTAVTPPQPKSRRTSAAKKPETSVVRRTVLGDTSGAKTTAGVVKHAVRASMASAQDSKKAAIESILASGRTQNLIGGQFPR